MISMKSNVAIVVSDYYEDISSGLVDGFTNSLDPKFTIDTHNVTGAWEIIHKINSLTDKYDNSLYIFLYFFNNCYFFCNHGYCFKKYRSFSFFSNIRFHNYFLSIYNDRC